MVKSLNNNKEVFKEKKCCVIIPTYNNHQTIEQVITDVLKYTDQVIVVNDGSTDTTQEILKNFDQIDVVSYPTNKGKGYALRQGFKFAWKQGYEYAITIDSDGQHLYFPKSQQQLMIQAIMVLKFPY